VRGSWHFFQHSTFGVPIFFGLASFSCLNAEPQGVLPDDHEYSIYWKSIQEAKVECTNKVLQVTGSALIGRFDAVDAGERLYVRECFESLFEAVWENRRCGKNTVLTGTPGVGKTAFRNYIVWRAVEKMKKEEVSVVALHHSPENPAPPVVVFDHSHGVRKLSKSSFKKLYGSDRKVLYLVDVAKGDSNCAVHGLVAGCTVMTTSPSEEAWKEFAKEKCRILVLPLWEKAEVKTFFQRSDFEEVFKKYGGVSRAFTDVEEVERRVKTAVDKLQLDDTANPIGTTATSGTDRHALVYFVRKEPASSSSSEQSSSSSGSNAASAFASKLFELQFGTAYLLDLAAQRCIELLHQQQTFVLSSIWPGTPGMRGDFYESVCHRLLVRGEKAELTELTKGKKKSPSSTQKELELPEVQDFEFVEGHDASEFIKRVEEL